MYANHSLITHHRHVVDNCEYLQTMTVLVFCFQSDIIGGDSVLWTKVCFCLMGDYKIDIMVYKKYIHFITLSINKYNNCFCLYEKFQLDLNKQLCHKNM